MKQSVPLVHMEDMGNGEWTGSSELPEDSNSWVNMAKVYVPAQSILIVGKDTQILTENQEEIEGSGVATYQEETLYLFKDESFDQSRPEAINANIYPLAELDVNVIETLNYTLNDIANETGDFAELQRQWWEVSLLAGQEITVGRPEDPVDQADFTFIASTEVSRPLDITPDTDPYGFTVAKRYRIVEDGTYFLMAEPGPLNDYGKYDLNALVQDLEDIEPNNSVGQATLLDGHLVVSPSGMKGIAVASALEGVDTDWFGLSLEPEHMLAVELSYLTGHENALRLEIRDPDGNVVFEESLSNGLDRDTMRYILPSLQGGQYAIGISGNAIGYRLAVRTGPMQDVAIAPGEHRIVGPDGAPCGWEKSTWTVLV